MIHQQICLLLFGVLLGQLKLYTLAYTHTNPNSNPNPNVHKT